MSEQAGWGRLLFDLELQTGFWISLVVGPEAEPRRRLREQVRRWCAQEGRPFYLHGLHIDSLRGVTRALQRRAGRPGLHWVLTDHPEAHDEGERSVERLLDQMNLKSAILRQGLGGGLILEGNEGLPRLVREWAPDLFRLRAAVVEAGIDPVLEEDSALGRRLVPELEDRPGRDGRSLIALVDRLRDQGSPRALLAALDRAAGQLHYERRSDQALRLADEQLILVTRLCEASPTISWAAWERVRALWRLGSIRTDAGDPVGAAEALDEGLARLAALGRDPLTAPAVDRLEARLCWWRGGVARTLGEPSLAWELGQRSTAIRRGLFRHDPDDLELAARLVRDLLVLARMANQLRRRVIARAMFQEALRMAEAQAERVPAGRPWDRLIEQVHRELGMWMLRHGHSNEAGRELEAAIAAAAQAADASPTDPELRRHQVEACFATAPDLARTGQILAARTHVEAARAQAAALLRVGALSPESGALLAAQGGQAAARIAQAAGESQRAIHEQREALAAVEQIPEGQVGATALRLASDLHASLARVALREGDSVEAGQQLARQEEALVRLIEGGSVEAGDLVLLRRALVKRAELATRERDEVAIAGIALRLVQTAELGFTRWAALPQLQRDRAMAHRRAATLFKRLGALDRARDLADEACLFADEIAGAPSPATRRERRLCHTLAGQLCIGAGEAEAARAHLELALTLAQEEGELAGVKRRLRGWLAQL